MKLLRNYGDYNVYIELHPCASCSILLIFEDNFYSIQAMQMSTKHGHKTCLVKRVKL
jgi:hypothetical protein